MKNILEKFSIIKFDEEKHLNLIPDLRILINEAYAPMAAQGMRLLGLIKTKTKLLNAYEKANHI